METKRMRAMPSSSTSAIDASPHPQANGRSRSRMEKGRDAGWMVDAVAIAGVAELPDDSTAGGSGTANVANASGRSHAATGITYEPTIAMTHAHRVARPARC